MARTLSFSPGIPEEPRWARRHSAFRRRDSFVARREDRKLIAVNAINATRLLIIATTYAPAALALYLLHREPATAVCQGSLVTGLWYKSRHCSLSWHRRRANREDEHTRRDQSGTSAVSGIADFLSKKNALSGQGDPAGVPPVRRRCRQISASSHFGFISWQQSRLASRGPIAALPEETGCHVQTAAYSTPHLRTIDESSRGR
jgi:hypothetical protein